MAQMGQEKLFEFPQVRGDVGAEAADPKSRALETDASGLNRRHHGAWGSSRSFIEGCSVSAVYGVWVAMRRKYWTTAMESGRAHDAIHRGFQSDRVGRDVDPDYAVGIRRPALPKEAGGTLALSTVSIGASPRDARIAAALYRRDPSSQTGVFLFISTRR